MVAVGVAKSENVGTATLGKSKSVACIPDDYHPHVSPEPHNSHNMNCV